MFCLPGVRVVNKLFASVYRREIVFSSRGSDDTVADDDDRTVSERGFAIRDSTFAGIRTLSVEVRQIVRAL